MPRSRIGAHALLAVVATLALVVVLQGSNPISDARGESPRIHLKAGSFDPLLAEPTFSPELASAKAKPGELTCYLVQFLGPIEPAWREAIEAAGGRILDHMPDYAYLVLISEETRVKVAGLSQVRWIGSYHTAFKLAGNLRDS